MMNLIPRTLNPPTSSRPTTMIAMTMTTTTITIHLMYLDLDLDPDLPLPQPTMTKGTVMALDNNQV